MRAVWGEAWCPGRVRSGFLARTRRWALPCSAAPSAWAPARNDSCQPWTDRLQPLSCHHTWMGNKTTRSCECSAKELFLINQLKEQFTLSYQFVKWLTSSRNWLVPELRSDHKYHYCVLWDLNQSKYWLVFRSKWVFKVAMFIFIKKLLETCFYLLVVDWMEVDIQQSSIVIVIY